MNHSFTILLILLFVIFTGCKKDSNPTSASNDSPTFNYAGKIYNTMKIGNQTWLKENLNVGTMIRGDQNQTNNGTIEKYCYDNDTANCSKYGGLYQWDEAMQYSTNPGVQGICPEGWHIPSYDEFQTLAKSVNGDGNSLKAIGEGYSDGAGTNTTGFGALLAGSRQSGGYFEDLHYYPFFWSTTTSSTSDAVYFYIPYENNYTGRWNTYSKDYGISVRCVKN